MTAVPLRKVAGNLVESAGFPVLKIEVDPSLRYVGGPDFILYNVARAEQHLFIEADGSRTIRRLLWIQFEGYLPEKSHTYDYSASHKIEISGLTFYLDSGWEDRSSLTEERPDSDGAAVRRHLSSLGYSYPQLVLHERFVTLSDDHRNELMIIYAEDAIWRGLTAEELSEDSEFGGSWSAVQKELHLRGLSSFHLLPV